MTGSARVVVSSGLLLSQFTRRYLQQNAFESLGIYKPLAKNLETTKHIITPTKLQQSFIPPILLGKDVLIRDTTGSGKTFGVLLSVLNKPRRRILVSSATGGVGGNGITSVVVVPNQELAFQLVDWTRELFPSADEEFIDGMIQAVVTPPPSPVDPTSSSTIATPAGSGTSTGKKARHRPRATALNNNNKADKDQIQKLAAHPPHVLVATPSRLWDLLQRGILDLSGIETLVLDEVDHLIRLPNRFASRKQILNRDVHPKPAELAVREILRSAQDVGRYPTLSTESTVAGDQDKLSEAGSDHTSSEKVDGVIERTGVGADRIQIIAASATMNRPMRHWLETTRGWVQDPTWIDTTKSVVLPEGIEHHCVIVGPDSVRNMRFDESQVGAAGGGGEEEVDMAETDRAWNNQPKSRSKDGSTLTSKEKEAEWKERNLTAPGVISSDVDSGTIEKFRDDDDRMLEGVAMACQLDEVKSACVFFCTSFSLKDLATRFEFEFGLPVKTIQNAFPTSTSTSALTTTTTGKKGRSTGIYLAHEENARGLDLPGLSHVFIVGLPSSPSSYLHMAGRTGRMGERGEVVTILRDDEFLEDRARSLFRMLNVRIEPYQHVE
ncbi:hypothetical protein BGZ96_008814 [Linnemannia gamsii]|uniref:RNA helicase n=1 Tax=Linnemannia gamsii TaxID=64522 RepID=A0ABQ7JY46_9FUNG|nr:hypothetical protein BGZ96_008814 [Linnemannia gamsii]